jgi:hypothetical protein
VDGADLAPLPEIIQAWAHFTVEAGGLAPQVHQRWDEHLPELLAGFAQAYADADSVEHRANCLEAYQLREYATPTPTGPEGLLGRLYEVLPGNSGLAGRMAPSVTKIEITAQVLQIKVLLRGSRPPVWRRLHVSPSTTLAGLHEVIQAAFGWDDDHLWVFDTDYGPFGPTPGLDHQNPHEVALGQLASEGAKFGYLFDFGDNWDHEIIVEKLVPATENTAYPVCIGGRQPDPVQYSFEDDEEAGSEAFDKDAINARLEALSPRA